MNGKSSGIWLIGKQYENKYLENTVKFVKPEKLKHTKIIWD